MYKVIKLTELTEHDFDNIIAAIIGKIINYKGKLYIYNLDYDSLTFKFLYNILSITQLAKKINIGICSKRRPFKKFIKKTKCTFLYRLKREPINEEYEDIIRICNRTIRDLYPNEIPYVVIQTISKTYYSEIEKENKK